MGHRGRPDLEEFKLHLLGLNRSQATAETYVDCLVRIERAAGKPIERITAQDLVAYRSVEASPATIQLTFTAVRTFHRFGVERGYWPLDGIMAVASPRRVRSPSEWLPQETSIALMGLTRSLLEVRLCYLGLYAGCRISESGAMETCHDRGDRLRFVGKGRKLREVPVHPVLRLRLDEIFARPALAGLQGTARRMRARTGIAFRPHMLRATFAHVLEEADVDHDVRAALLGHASTQTMGYSGVSWRRKVEAIERLHY